MRIASPSRVAIALAALFGALVLTRCEKHCTTTSPCPTATPGGGGSCTNVAGSRNAFWSDSCGGSGSGVMVISQTGCNFTATLTGLGTFTGTVSGSTLNYTLEFTGTCSGSATGTATVSGPNVTGTYSGTQTGSGCCPNPTGNITFQFVPTVPPTSATPTPLFSPTPTFTPSLTATPGF